ncbi:(R)-mandelonitrile lyase 1-like [Ziziphus jujuba]|uniref:(R)-mandelonitrile lyase n=1 Tax=Ziziphus jujuba TaxID=326968 RepID=A0ABM4AH91_ZIZJJ|nr:(R)-mandelonitrile lyase 1-like [Ziziphus jujuba]
MAAALLLFLLSYILHPQLEVLALATSSDLDFSYMKSVHNATDLPLEDVYDYIIVGGGTAGCPLAATLSEKYSVLVLERGSTPAAYPQVLASNSMLNNLLQEDNGKTPAQRFVSEEGVKVVRGRILGGTSMINGGFFSRADDQFYNEAGVDWDKDMVEKAYQWVEDTIVFSYNLSTFQSILRKGLLQAGVGPDNGFTLQHLAGTKTSGSTFDDQGRRHGAVQLLNKGVLHNLRVAVEAYVEKITFRSSNNASRLSATGVIYKDSVTPRPKSHRNPCTLGPDNSKGRTHRAFVKDRGEVILSAGAIGSPQLLLLSGVGPVPHLSSLHIPVVYSNPDVGNFIADNPRNGINIVAPYALDGSNPQVVGVVGGAGDFNVIEGFSYISPFSFPQPFSLFPNSTSPLQLSVAAIVHKISGPQLTGSLRLLSSAEVKVSPAVRFNYFSEPVDLARCVRGMRKIGDMLKTDSFEELKFEKLEGAEGFTFLAPSLPKNQSDDASIETFCRSTVTTYWHYHGGCLLGKVLDGDYRVKGTNSLRVVDGSTFKASPGTNPQATLMMIGRYIGLKILQERRAAK